MTDLSEQALEQALRELHDNATLALHPRWMVIPNPQWKYLKPIRRALHQRRMAYLRKRGAR